MHGVNYIMSQLTNANTPDGQSQTMKPCHNGPINLKMAKKKKGCQYKCVTFTKSLGRYRGFFVHKKVPYYCGYHDTEEEASIAVNQKRIELGLAPFDETSDLIKKLILQNKMNVIGNPTQNPMKRISPFDFSDDQPPQEHQHRDTPPKLIETSRFTRSPHIMELDIRNTNGQ
eukprot:UN24022